MADVRAFRSGNWSSTTATSPWWNGSAIFAPEAGDNVYTNNFLITVDVSVNLGASSVITNGPATSRIWKDGATTTAASFGSLILTNGVTLTANCTTAATTNLVSIAGTASASIVGNLTSSVGAGSTCVTNSSSGTLTITGNLLALSNAAVVNNSTGAVVVTGNAIGGTATSGNAISNTSSGTITLIGNVTAGASAAGANNASTGAFTIIGDITATNGANGFISASTSATNRLSGSFINSANGIAAIYASKYVLWTTPLLAKTRYALDGISTYVDMFTSDNNPNGGVATTDVRLGVSYGGGLVGTCAVPNAGTVAFGVAVDNTTGTATLTAANLRAALGLGSANLDSQLAVLSNLDTTVSSRLAPSGTLATVTTLTNSPNVPSAAAIADEVRVELATELARIDAPISGATAPSASTVATAVRSELATELARVDVATSTRLATSGYTAPTTPPTAADNASAVRTELATELARVDAAVSTRLAGSAYTAPSNSDVTAIKAKTDLLETTRLAQCSTVATTGAQIAAALS